jgi:aryl-alcohol dehydrogenase-like predicted oxidoreductase
MWLLSKPNVEAPIASARTPEQLNDILPSMQLDPDQVARLDEASA